MKKYIAILFISLPLVLQAQTDSSLHYWDITLHIGPYLSGVPMNIEKEMERVGFRRPTGLFGGSTGASNDLPSEGRGFQGGIERITTQSCSFKLLLSAITGKVNEFSSRYGDLRIHYAQIASSFLIGYHSKLRITRIAFGPSLHVTTLKTDKISSSSLSEKITKAGFVIEAGLRFPAKSKLFFDFNTQYQYVGRQDLGTYQFGQAGEVVIGKKPSSYICFNFGLGFRFGKLLKL